MLKAIQTHYKGYHFRSRLEARWAVFFDALGLEWEYEKEGYDLGNAGWYLPDFWLPDFWTLNQGLWIEIKPNDLAFSDELDAQHKMQILIDQSESSGYIFRGQPVDENGTYYFFNTKIRQSKLGTYEPGEPWDVQKYSPSRIKSAYVAARSARFEHGQTPRFR